MRELKPWEIVWRVVVLVPGDGNPGLQVHGVFRSRLAAEQEAMCLKERDPVNSYRAEPWDPYIQQIVDGRPEQGELQWSKTIVFKGDGRCYCMDVSGPPIPMEEIKVKRRTYRVAHQGGVFYWHCARV